MRRHIPLITSLVLTISGLVMSPAHATTLSDGDYVCTTGVIKSTEETPTYAINSGVVTSGASCAGAVVIAEGVTSIGNLAFENATALTSISIPASVTSILQFAFLRTPSLASVTFESGSNLLIIHPFAFYGATSLASITIPASVTSIDERAFEGATALSSITVAGANANYSSAAGVLFNKLFTTLIIWPVGKGGTSYTIPAGVTSIGERAFALTGIPSIVIPASVTSIGAGAFNRASLASVTFASGSKLVSIGTSAFEDAFSLTSISIPAGVTSIGEGAFNNATSLASVTFASGSKLVSIGDYAFNSATALTSISIPAGVTSIGDDAFYDATALAEFYFRGDAPTTYGAYAFTGVSTGAKAYIKSGATGFDLNTDGDGNSGVWAGLIVTVGFYTVTYNTTGGSEVDEQDYGANLPTSTSPTRTGYTFAGWSATAGGPVITWPNTPALGSDITLYAKWTRNSVKAATRVKPTVSGTAKVSKTLTAKKGTWTGYPNPAFTYQWYACTKKVTVAKATVPSTCKKITGATKSTLKLAKAQKGKFIAVLVTGKGTGTTATKWLSKSTTKVG